MAGIVFGEQAAKQIAETVRKVHRQKQNALKRGTKFRKTVTGNGPVLAQLGSSLTALGAATASLLSWDGASYGAAGGVVTVYDAHNNPYLDTGTRVVISRFTGRGWIVIEPFQSFVIGSLDGDLTQSGNATLSIFKASGGSEADSTVNLTVYGWPLPSGKKIPTGSHIGACRSYGNTVWYPVITDTCATT